MTATFQIVVVITEREDPVGIRQISLAFKTQYFFFDLRKRTRAVQRAKRERLRDLRDVRMRVDKRG